MKKVIIILIIFSLLFVSLFLLKKEEEKADKNISVILETEEGNLKSKTFPSKDEYVYNKTVCENTKDNIKVNFDKETWKLDLNVEEDSIDGNFFCNIYFMKKSVWEYDYTGNYQTFVVPINGKYKFELWGSDLLFENNVGDKNNYNGAYTSGEILLSKNEELYIYVGEAGKKNSINTTFNGGGSSSKGSYCSTGGNSVGYCQNYSGGGATDVRLVSGEWNNTISLRSRIMVAAGSGRASCGGGLTSESTYKKDSSCASGESKYYAYGATQTSAGYSNKNTLYGDFGVGGNGEVTTLYYGSSGGGGGYYGGGGGYSKPFDSQTSHERCGLGYSSGGSSYISGHTGCVAVTSENDTTPKNGCTTGTTNNSCSIHYSGKKFINTVMIDGYGNNWTNVKGEEVGIPNPLGGYFNEGEGIGNGYVKISLIE